ncbi:MAG: radical SAM protein [Planctomycetes bacterium]|nr:radical SAM protein [Planctomycetota bacterium]
MPRPANSREALLQPRMREVIVEATSRCNLRCLYCAVSQPGYVGRDLEGDPQAILRGIVELGPREVQINGHGETTMLPGWVELARLLTESGVPVTLTSNLARPYESRELEALSRLMRLTVSCDSSDPALYARLRRGGRLEQLEANLDAIRNAARARGERGPRIAINCTFSHLVVAGLPELVRWAARKDLDAVALTNLVVYPGLPGKLVLRHPAQVDPLGTQRSVAEAQRIARELGLDFYTMGGLDEDLERAAAEVRAGRARLVDASQRELVPPSPKNARSAPSVEHANAAADAADEVSATAALAPSPDAGPASPSGSTEPLAPDAPAPSTPAHSVPAGMTRDCVDPWEYAFVHADGGVSLCCWAPAIGNLRDASLAELVRGAQARAMRVELLSGTLGPACGACPARGSVTPHELEQRVQKLLSRPRFLQAGLRRLRELAKRARRRLRRSFADR